MKVWSGRPASHELLTSQRWTTALLGWSPTRWRNLTRQQFVYRPAMVSNAGSNGRRARNPFVTADDARPTQGLVICTEVVDRADQVQTVLQAGGLTSQRASTTDQSAQARAKGRVQAFNVSGMDGRGRLGLLQHGFDLGGCALHDPTQHTDDPMAGIPFDDLRNQDAVPRTQSRSARLARGQRFTQDLLNRADIGTKAIRAESQRPTQGAGSNFLHELNNQVIVALCTHRPTQPQAATHLQGTGQPDDAALFFHAQLVQLYLSQVTRLLHQVCMHACALLSRSHLPVQHGAFIQLKGHHDRLQRTAMRQQRDHDGHQLDRTMQAIERRPFPFTKRLLTDTTAVPSLFLTVDSDVALPTLASCWTVPIRAEYLLRVHVLAHLHSTWLSNGLCR